MSDAVIVLRSVICQECKYARHELGPIAAAGKAVRHMLARTHIVHEVANGFTINIHRPNMVYKGETPPF